MFLIRDAYLPQVALFISNKAFLLLLALGFWHPPAKILVGSSLNYSYSCCLYSSSWLASDGHHSTHSMKSSMYISWFKIMSCAFSPSHLSWYLCCNIFYLPFVDLEWMDLNFEIVIYKVFRRFHHHHFLKLFLKTYGFSYQTATSNNCYYLFSFYQWSTRLSNYLPRSHTANLV